MIETERQRKRDSERKREREREREREKERQREREREREREKGEEDTRSKRSGDCEGKNNVSFCILIMQVSAFFTLSLNCVVLLLRVV